AVYGLNTAIFRNGLAGLKCLLFDNGFFKRGASKFYLFILIGHRIKKLERSDDFSVCVHKLCRVLQNYSGITVRL
ncbi:MAG: hypothetical protein LBJ47_05925, partial [Tannerella sp.]|nr:hypothetical protein [Tannerella sp.]